MTHKLDVSICEHRII